MGRYRERRQEQQKLPGAWLAFLAVAVQVLLPFIVAYEIALAGSPAYADDFPICHAAGPANTAPGSLGNHVNPNSCPICAAMAVGHAFTAPPPIAAPLPQILRYVDFDVSVPVQRIALACAPYQSRAPPALI